MVRSVLEISRGQLSNSSGLGGSGVIYVGITGKNRTGAAVKLAGGVADARIQNCPESQYNHNATSLGFLLQPCALSQLSRLFPASAARRKYPSRLRIASRRFCVTTMFLDARSVHGAAGIPRICKGITTFIGLRGMAWPFRRRIKCTDFCPLGFDYMSFNQLDVDGCE